ncbi:PD-(D/E)XK nuclease family protein [Xylanimonas ulmi]|uniref:PD-(D/E)XK nuclease family protein n=1 Tax=Xylanimonas ulmi TaxID=228973 RepID=UPI0013EE5937|nr:PD-(D/E)XK nuclease family protein [Xylanibacterium ulmi]
MRLHHSEVHLCAGLAWLLTPDGWHGLGSTLLSAFLTQVGVTDVDQRALHSATIVTEEYRIDGRVDDVAPYPTRADIVVRVPLAGICVVLEAKVWAAEQPQQCQRLAELWEDESPTLVFLTRSGIAPTTARPDDEWRLLTWQSVSSLLSAAVGRTNPHPGVRDYLETIEEYGGRPA